MIRLPAVLVLAGLVLLTACSDDPVRPPAWSTRVTAVVLHRDTGEPVAGVKILPVDAATNSPLSSHLASDEDGRAVFKLNPPANMRLLAFGGGDWQIHGQDDWPRLFAAHAKTPPVFEIMIRVIVAPAPPVDGLPRIRGTVVDAVTGEPLADALVGTSPWLTAYGGDTGPDADVTGADGAFSVGEIPFVALPGGDVAQVTPLVIGREGYRSRTWRHEPAPGDDNLDITGVEIALERIEASDTGVLTGVVLRDGTPLAGARVGLGGAGADKVGFGVPGQVAETDSAGRFTFTDLPAGRYVAQPGFLLGDGVLLPGQPAARGYDVATGQTTSTDDFTVLHEIRARGPWVTWGASHADSALFAWTAVPGAAFYRVGVDGNEIGATDQTSLNWPFPNDLPAGWHRFSVIAEGRGGIIGAMERSQPFLARTD